MFNLTIGRRWFSITSRIMERGKPNPKKKLKRLQQVKTVNKQKPESHPLYMPITKAFKYIRAAEVGEEINKSTISLLLTVIPERGSKPLSGFIKFPNPVKDSKLLIFSNDEDLKLPANMNPNNYVIGGSELVEEINQDKINLSQFTHSFSTSDFVPNLRPIARTLGIKNLLIAPRRGNVASASELPSLIEESLGSMPFKQKGQHLSFPVGRCDFTDKQLLENISIASKTIYDLQPPGTRKPNLIGQTCISSTKGPSLVINFRN